MSAVRSALLGLLLLLTACGGEDVRAGGAPSDASVTSPAPQPEEPRPAEPRLGPYARSELYLERDIFLAADAPRTTPAHEASFLRSGDEVLGIVVGGHPRAYPVTMLSYHHVVNDVIEGIPVAVTY